MKKPPKWFVLSAAALTLFALPHFVCIFVWPALRDAYIASGADPGLCFAFLMLGGCALAATVVFAVAWCMEVIP